MSELLDDDRGGPKNFGRFRVAFNGAQLIGAIWIGLGKQLGYLCILGAAAPERTRAGGLFEVPLVVQ